MIQQTIFEKKMQIQEKINKLNGYEVLILYLYSIGFKYIEIADMLGITRKAIRQRIVRIKKKVNKK